MTLILAIPPNTQTSVAYFSLRWADSASGRRTLHSRRHRQLFKYVVHNPTLFGFYILFSAGGQWSGLEQSTYHTTRSDHQNHALWALPLTPTQQQTFLFVDDVHLTTAGQTIEADYEYSLLVAPSQVSLVVQSAVQNGLAIADTIQRQIDLSIDFPLISGNIARRIVPTFGPPLRPTYLRIKNAHGFPGVSGVPFDGTIGVDYRTQCGAILGVAFTVGYQKQKFSKIGGHFNQVVEAPSLYAAYKYGRVWGNVDGELIARFKTKSSVKCRSAFLPMRTKLTRMDLL